MARYNTRSGRLFRVARSLRYLKMLRLGPSTHSTRLGEKELVLRSGIHRINSAEKYWRGIPVVIIFQQSVETWEIHLLEPKLHAALLDIFGTIEYGSQDPHNLDDAYKRIYTAVMGTGPVCEHLKVDYAPFFSQFRPVPVTSFSRRLEATEESELGQIARRVAADAVLYVKDPDARFRTQQHVTCINECLENALQSYMHPASDNNYVAINISSPSSILR